jgi:hypothetical protein
MWALSAGGDGFGFGAEFGDDALQNAIDHADGAASVQDLGMLSGQP